MRKLMWFVIGFAASCGLCAYGLSGSWIIPAAVICLVLTVLALMVCRKWGYKPILAVMCLGCTLGFGWFGLFHKLYLAPVIALDATERNASFVATDYSYETDYGIGIDCLTEVAGKKYQTRIYVNDKREIEPGDRISGTFRFRVTTPDGQEDATYHQGMGIFLLAYQRGTVEIVKAEGTPWWCFGSVLKARIEALLEGAFPQDTVTFAKGLLLGDTSDLDYETDTDFKLSGIRHVVAVSGLHISILFALIGTLTFRKRYLTALLGIPMLVLFAAVAGFTPSVNRACIMSGLMLTGRLVDKEYDGATSLSFASLVMLAVNPLAITSVSFQLSVGSVAGIFLFQERIQKWMLSRFGEEKRSKLQNRLIHGLAASVSVTLSAMIFTTPLSACYFRTVSLVGMVTNLLSLWVIGFIFYGLMAVCLLQCFWHTGASLLAKLISVPMRYVLAVAKAMANLPVAAVYTQSVYVVVWLGFCYVLLLMFLFQKKRRPVILGCCACIGLCVALLASWAEPILDETKVTVLDVGQGQAILLQGEGRTYLVDCGGDSEETTADLVAETLLSQGINRLDGVILTHYDADHAGGLDNLLTRIQTDLLFIPDTVDAKAYPQAEGTVCYVDEDMLISFGDAEIRIYGPIYSGSSNENSLCVLFETENCVILITGDRSDFGERMLMRHTQLPDVDLLIAGHHGAGDSTSVELLQAVTPETVIISVGADNPYGHPADALLERLAEFGCMVYRTDQNGTIIFRR